MAAAAGAPSVSYDYVSGGSAQWNVTTLNVYLNPLVRINSQNEAN